MKPTPEIQERMDRLTAIRLEAGQIADQIDLRPFDAASWEELTVLHHEAADLRAEVARQGGFPDDFSGGAVWTRPSVAFDTLLTSAQRSVTRLWKSADQPGPIRSVREILNLQ